MGKHVVCEIYREKPMKETKCFAARSLFFPSFPQCVITSRGISSSPLPMNAPFPPPLPSPLFFLPSWWLCVLHAFCQCHVRKKIFPIISLSLSLSLPPSLPFTLPPLPNPQNGFMTRTPGHSRRLSGVQTWPPRRHAGSTIQ